MAAARSPRRQPDSLVNTAEGWLNSGVVPAPGRVTWRPEYAQWQREATGLPARTPAAAGTVAAGVGHYSPEPPKPQDDDWDPAAEAAASAARLASDSTQADTWWQDYLASKVHTAKLAVQQAKDDEDAEWEAKLRREREQRAASAALERELHERKARLVDERARIEKERVRVELEAIEERRGREQKQQEALRRVLRLRRALKRIIRRKREEQDRQRKLQQKQQRPTARR